MWCVWFFAGFFVALLLTFYVSLLPFWFDVWGRLGPSECYAAVGLGIWLICALGICTSNRPRGIHIIGLVVSSFVLYGSKETLLPFAGFSVIILLFQRNKIDTKILILALAGCLLPSGIIAGVVLIQLKLSAYADFFEKDLGDSSRFEQFIHVIQIFARPALGIIIVSAFARLWADPVKWRHATINLVIVTILIFLVYLSQILMYGSHFFYGRYEFPAQLCLPAFWLALTIYLGAVDASRSSDLRIRQTLFLCILIIVNQFYSNRTDRWRMSGATITAVSGNIEATRRFSSKLQEVVEQAHKRPENLILLDMHGGGTYEQAQAAVRYLFRNKIENPIALRYNRLSTDTNALANRLAAAMEDLQENALSGTDNERLKLWLRKTFKEATEKSRMHLIPLKDVGEETYKTAIIWNFKEAWWEKP